MPRHGRPTTVYPIGLRQLEVLRIVDLTPGLRRVTLTGDQLGAFTTEDGIETAEFASTGFDDDIRLFFPYPGATTTILPRPKDGGLIFPRDPRPLSKNYTVRNYRADVAEVDVDFIKHGVGIATTWAYRTAPGEQIHIAGPSASLGLPEDVDWLLVAGDDTALPAIARLLEELPGDARAQVFIEIAEDSLRIDLRELPGVELTWLPRNGALAGTTTLLADAVAAAPWWPGRVFGWVAGEQSTVRDLRRHLVDERGLDKTALTATGYWKRQLVVAQEDDTDVPDPERNTEAFERFLEKAEILPPLAIRIAANLGLGEHISRGTTGVAELAAVTGTDRRALGKLLRYLEAIELVESVAEGYRLSETGEFLTDRHVLEVIHHSGVEARRERALFGLEESVRTGAAGYASVTGTDYPTLREDPAFEHRMLENKAEFAPYLSVPLAEARAFLGARHVVVHSTGAGAIATALVHHLPEVRVTIPARATTADWLRQDLPRSVPDEARRARIEVIEQAATAPTPPADVVLIVRALAEYPDDAATAFLRSAARSLTPGGRILVLEDTLAPEEPDEQQTEHDLLLLALHGSGRRTTDELGAVITAAGLTVVETEAVGWGAILRTAAPSQ